MALRENKKEMYGYFKISPKGPFEAGTYTTVAFRIVIGKAGLKAGGCVKVATPNMGWGRPICLTPRSWDELLVATDRIHNPWKPINTTWTMKSKSSATLNIRVDENLLSDPAVRSMIPNDWRTAYGQWRWWITGRVERDNLSRGDEILITYGDTENEPFGVRVQPWIEKDRNCFVAMIDLTGENRYQMIHGSPVYVDVVPGPPERIVAVIPSIAQRGEDILVRTSVLDRNLCPPASPYAGKLSFESEDITLPQPNPTHSGTAQGKVKQEGIVRVSAPDIESVKTNPLIVGDASGEKLFWGDLHAQSRYHQWKVPIKRGDSCNTPGEIHAYARDCSMLDFVAITDGGGAYTKNPGWEETQQAAIDCCEPGRYVSFKGWECGMAKQGDKCVVYRSAEIEPHIPYMHELATKYSEPSQAHALIKFYRNHKERVLTIPHSFMKYLDWSVVDPELDRILEIYSTWGSYESREDNPLNSKKKPKNQSAQHAWRMGYILGVVAAGDSHIGYPGRSISYGDRFWCQCFKAGLCAVYAKELTRTAIWDALYNRYCYGTTGVRIVLQFELNGARMGSIVEYKKADDALLKRDLRVSVAGTDFIRRVDILKNNYIIHRCEPESDRAEFTFTDRLSEIPVTRDWYYVRVFQADGNAAWASPIWVAPVGCDGPSPSDRE